MPEQTELDEGLIERVREGDLDAFNELVLAYQEGVYNLCLRMLGSRQAAEDATQDAFISALKNATRLRGANVRSWLFRIASNTCIDELRRRKRQRVVSLDAAVDEDVDRPIEVPDSEPGPEARAVQAELHRLLRTELLRLPEDQRLAVTLCDLQEFQYEEIAQITGSSVGTVKSRISRGRAKLREAIRTRPELFGHMVRPRSEGGTDR